MVNLSRRLLRLESLLVTRRLPSDPRQWRADDFAVYFASLSPDERAQLDAQANAELEAWHEQS